MSSPDRGTPAIANIEGERFEADLQGHKAVLEYHLEGHSVVFTHIEVPRQFEGQGIGGELARAGLDYARHRNLKVVPLCPFVKNYLEKHPEDQDLVRAQP
jgi:predicted GNAT family acetyltransferase